jgi:RNA polymerase sigma-70 factor (ECF subfamily)
LVATITSRVAAALGETGLPSFACAVDTHKAMVYSIAWHILRDRALAEELAQDVFLELHRNWGSMKSAGHVLFWLRRTAVNRGIDYQRKRKIRAETSLEEVGEPTVLERMHDTFLSAYLERMLASLPERQRIAIVLRYQEDMSPEQIAEVLGMKVNTVKTHIARGLELLRSKTAQRLRGERIEG